MPDLTTIAGIVALSMIITAVIISKMGITDENVKKLISAGIAAILGVGSKLVGIGFVGTDWQTLIVGIIVAIFGAKLTYDSVIKPVAKTIKKKKQ